MSAPAVSTVMAESASLLRAVDSDKGSFLDQKADDLDEANVAVTELMEAYAAYFPKWVTGEVARISPEGKRLVAAHARCKGEGA